MIAIHHLHTGDTSRAGLETAWIGAHWNVLKLRRPLVFLWVRALSWPVTIQLCLRSRKRGAGDADGEPHLEHWAPHPDGPVTIAAPTVGDSQLLRYFVGTNVSGIVVASSGAGQVLITDEDEA